MKIANSLLFAAFVLGAGTLLLAQDHASPNVFNMRRTTLLSSRNTAGVMRADEVFALLSDSAGYSDPSVSQADPPAEPAVLSDFYNEAPLNNAGSSANGDDPPAEPAVLSDFCNEAPLNGTSSCSANKGDPPAESADPPNPCGKGSTTDADYGMPDGF